MGIFGHSEGFSSFFHQRTKMLVLAKYIIYVLLLCITVLYLIICFSTYISPMVMR